MISIRPPLSVASVPAPVAAYRHQLRSKSVAGFSKTARTLREWQIATNPHYPLFHFTAPEGWNNDPNGLVHDPATGIYHRFYQYRPVDAGGEELPTAWGHTVSRDLAHWEDWPVAMFADTPWDSAGVYSGNIAIGADGIPTAVYTGNVAGHAKTFGVCARSFDGFVTWNKTDCMDASRRPNAASPVNWDTFVWKDAGTYNALIGGCTDPPGGVTQGTAYLWQSSDLQDWAFVGPIWSGGPGPFWELPYLLPFDASGEPAPAETADRWALLFGHGNAVWVGAYNRSSHQFSPSGSVADDGSAPAPQISDPGSYYSFNAAMTDDAGLGGRPRRLMFGWVTGGSKQPYWEAQAHSLLREVTLAPSAARLVQQPAPEVELLRTAHLLSDSTPRQIVPGSTGHVAAHAFGASLEVSATFALPEDAAAANANASAFGVLVRGGTADGAERVRFEVGSRAVTSGGLSGAEKRTATTLPPAGSNVTLRIFVDRSVCEVFCSGAAITTRLFPKEPLNATAVDVFAEGTPAQLLALDIYAMGSMWAPR